MQGVINKWIFASFHSVRLHDSFILELNVVVWWLIGPSGQQHSRFLPAAKIAYFLPTVWTKKILGLIFLGLNWVMYLTLSQENGMCWLLRSGLHSNPRAGGGAKCSKAQGQCVDRNGRRATKTQQWALEKATSNVWSATYKVLGLFSFSPAKFPLFLGGGPDSRHVVMSELWLREVK